MVSRAHSHDEPQLWGHDEPISASDDLHTRGKTYRGLISDTDEYSVDARLRREQGEEMHTTR
jgi:hypothetical protein